MHKVDKILIDLDCLWDTRAAILENVASEVLDEIFGEDQYHDRYSDFFSDIITGFDNQKFLDAYAKRTIDDIRGKVVMTNMALQVLEHVKNCKVTKENVPIRQTVHLTINTFPYEFAESEKVELEKVFGVVFRDAESISFARVSPQWLAPKALFEFTQWVTYEFDLWLTIHGEELKRNKKNSFIISTPIRMSKPNAKESIDIGDSAAAVSMMLAEHLSLSYLPLKDFSFDRELVKKYMK